VQRLVQEPVQIRSSPARHEVHPDVQRCADPLDRSQAQLPSVSRLDERDRGLMHAGAFRHVALAQAAADANGTDRAAELATVHPSERD